MFGSNVQNDNTVVGSKSLSPNGAKVLVAVHLAAESRSH